MKTNPIYPFSAIVGQEKMKLALILNVINPGLSGVLIRGEKGTAKSTAVRTLADILPEIPVLKEDPFQLDPLKEYEAYLEIRKALQLPPPEEDRRPPVISRKVRVVELPVGATDDRVAIMKRRVAFDQAPEEFSRQWTAESEALVERIRKATVLYPRVEAESAFFYEIAEYCLSVGVDGHRGDIIMLKTAKTLAAYDGRTEVCSEDVQTAADLVLPHRVRRQPLMEIADNIQKIRDRGGKE
jgi:Mg-chelatase subunit ChlI